MTRPASSGPTCRQMDAKGVNSRRGYQALPRSHPRSGPITPGALHSASESRQYAVSFPRLPGDGVARDPHRTDEEERHGVTRTQTPSTPGNQRQSRASSPIRRALLCDLACRGGGGGGGSCAHPSLFPQMSRAPRLQTPQAGRDGSHACVRHTCPPPRADLASPASTPARQGSPTDGSDRHQILLPPAWRPGPRPALPRQPDWEIAKTQMKQKCPTGERQFSGQTTFRH